MAQALYRQWRPLIWSEVVGQEHVVRTLQNAVEGERISHAYLFSGPRGTGKTSVARLLANGQEPDRRYRQTAHAMLVRHDDLFGVCGAARSNLGEGHAKIRHRVDGVRYLEFAGHRRDSVPGRFP